MGDTNVTEIHAKVTALELAIPKRYIKVKIGLDATGKKWSAALQKTTKCVSASTKSAKEEITMCCANSFGQNTVEVYKYNPLKDTRSFHQAKHVCEAIGTFNLCTHSDVLAMVNTHQNGAHSNGNVKTMTSYSQDTTY